MREQGHLLRDAAKGLQYACSGDGERGAFIIYRKRPVISPSLFRGSTMEIQLAFGNVFHILFCAGTFAGLPPPSDRYLRILGHLFYWSVEYNTYVTIYVQYMYHLSY
jgi:hypothetical protein